MDFNLKDRGGYGGEIILDLIFDSTAKELPGWVTEMKKFEAKISFRNAQRVTVREINFLDAVTNGFSGSFVTSISKYFILTMKLTAERLTLA